uniref:Epithelial stromal interaction 1 n=1 Tax=Sus scrofa TaxID=9823 RepID=A0A8D0WMG5_PIG
MYTRSAVLGSGVRAPAASRPDRDPPERRRELGPPQGAGQGLEAAAESPSRESLEHERPRFTGAYTLITPSEKRRSELQRMATKELEDLERWKEQQRAKPIHLEPRRLGGSQSEAEVRQRQQLQLIQSKYQKKLKREEQIRLKKEAEEAEIQKMKVIQREKSNKLEEKKRHQEELRREAFREHRQYKTTEFLRRINTELPPRSTCPEALGDSQSSAWARSRAYMDSRKEEENQKLQKMKEVQHQKSELLEFKRQQQEEERIKTHQAERRRIDEKYLRPSGLCQVTLKNCMRCFFLQAALFSLTVFTLTSLLSIWGWLVSSCHSLRVFAGTDCRTHI